MAIVSETAYEKGQTLAYEGTAAWAKGDGETFEIAGTFNVIETGDGYAVLEDVRADELCEIPKYDRALTRYRITTKA